MFCRREIETRRGRALVVGEVMICIVEQVNRRLRTVHLSCEAGQFRIQMPIS